MRVKANGIAIEVEDFGPPDRPAVVLVMGLLSRTDIKITGTFPPQLFL